MLQVLLNKVAEETKNYVQVLKEALQLLGYSETQVVLKVGVQLVYCQPVLRANSAAVLAAAGAVGAPVAPNHILTVNQPTIPW